MKFFREHKRLVLHGGIILASFGAAIFFPPLILLLFFGYWITGLILFIRLIMRRGKNIWVKLLLLLLTFYGGIVSFAFMLIPAFLFCSIVSEYFPDSGENVPEKTVRGRVVRNVSYRVSAMHSVWEFDTTENEFMLLAGDLPCAGIRKETPARAFRRDYFAWNNKDREKNSVVLVKDGLYAGRRGSNGGGITMIFDRADKRGYIHICPR